MFISREIVESKIDSSLSLPNVLSEARVSDAFALVASRAGDR
jgi:hypothetical protein